VGIILGPFVGGTQDQHQELESLAENGNLSVASGLFGTCFRFLFWFRDFLLY
jgi:hypothetical protein